MTSQINDLKSTRVIKGMAPSYYDKVEVTYPTATTEVYTFILTDTTLPDKTVGIITLTYTDSTKADLSSAIRTNA